MSDAPRFTIEDDMDYRAEKPKRGWGRSCLIGCLWTSAVLAVIVAVLGVWVFPKLRGWASSLGSQAIKETINAANIPQQEKAELGVEVDRVAAAFSKGDLSGEQVVEIMNMIMQSPLAGAIAVAVADAQYFEASGLSEEEKTAGRVTLQRFTLGAIDGRIPQAKRDEVLALVGQKDGRGNWQLRDRVSDEELRAFLAKALAEADAAGIEAQPPAVDLSDELKRIVDAALANRGVLPEAMPEAAPAAQPEAQPGAP